ncbi:hypothetical protein B0H16DRAFT_1758385 [Mycena metata]|uniref:Uncharacterized protein n=1 Tax=Mycena metata TaxID=1033252 RepID=A0AAD7IC59_9AGAR|nr:hypothetical protein B0H16DRAFT_1758385 [Mycena metata]
MKFTKMLFRFAYSFKSAVCKTSSRVQEFVSSRSDIVELCFQFAAHQAIVKSLLRLVVDLEQTAGQMAEHAEEVSAAGCDLADVVEVQTAGIEAGVAYVEELLAEVQGYKEKRMWFEGELQEKDDCIAYLEAEVAKLAAAYEDEQACVKKEMRSKERTIFEQQVEIATLRAASKVEQTQIKDNIARTAEYEMHLLKTSNAHATRERVHTQTIAAQAEDIKSLSAMIEILQVNATAVLVNQTAEDAAAVATTKGLRKKIRGLEGKISAYQDSDARAAAQLVKHTKTIASQAEEISRLTTDLKRLNQCVVESAAQAVVKQLHVTEQVKDLERRIAEREKELERTRRASENTVKHLADRHVKELAHARGGSLAIKEPDASMGDLNPTSANLSTSSVCIGESVSRCFNTMRQSPEGNFSMDCGYHFATQFTVPVNSPLAQASIAAPAPFVRDQRKITEEPETVQEFAPGTGNSTLASVDGSPQNSPLGSSLVAVSRVSRP